MKKLTMSLLTLTLIMFLCGSAYATEFEARGSAVVTGMRARYVSSTSFTRSHLWVTNITGSDVDCRVTVYDHAGNDVTSYCVVYSGTDSGNGAVTIATGTGTFALPAGATRYVNLAINNTSRHIQGHAVIEWSSEDVHLRKALIALGASNYRSGDRGTQMAIPVNGGQPF